ncbi:hypothetical protein J4477_02095 [Candidatus Pacearchaeota archaeon]|nr:hypothetical protein [Candidatus Pacearchaeota archaeon]
MVETNYQAELEEFWEMVNQMPRSEYLDALAEAKKARYHFQGHLESPSILRDVYSGRIVFR